METNIGDIRKIFENNVPKAIGKHTYFSVLVPFVEIDGKLYLLFEVRAKHMSRQPGEICFPGGKVEKGETPTQAAIRETYEEIGIKGDDIEIIGEGNTIKDHVTFTIFSRIGLISKQALEQMKLEKDEVDEVFLVEFDKLRNYEPEMHYEQVLTKVADDFPLEKVGITADYPWRAGTWDIPIYDVDNRVIWGLTARIVQDICKYLD